MRTAVLRAEQASAPQELLASIQRLLELRDGRAPLVLVETRGSAKAALQAILTLLNRQLGHEGVEFHRLGVDDASRERLRALNRQRDVLLPAMRLVLLEVDSPEALRLARELAPDLLSVADLEVRLAARDPAKPWPALAAALADMMRERHETMDFTGLLPQDVERREVPLEELFLDLVDLSRPTQQTIDFKTDSLTARARAVLVLADPGAGKTTLLRHLAVVYARGEGDPLGVGAATPLLLPLADLGPSWVGHRVTSLMDFLPLWLEEQGLEGASDIREHLRDVVLLLDGLDELSDPNARRLIVREVASLVRRAEVRAVVVSSRSHVVDELAAADLSAFEIKGCEPPSEDQVRGYLGRFVRLRGRHDHPSQVASELTRAIFADADLRALVRAPLLLMFLALLHELEGRLPDRRVELYARLGELLVERWVRVRSLSEQRRQRATPGQAYRVLGPLAWWVVERGGAAVGEAEIEEKLVELEARREGEVEARRRARSLLALLTEDSALLRPVGGRKWAFVHLSVAEYFAAKDAVRDPTRMAHLEADPFALELREIVLFTAGILGVMQGATGPLDRLVERVLAGCRRTAGGRYGARHPSLLVGLLREDPELSRRQKEALLERLMEFWFFNAMWPTSAWLTQLEAVKFLEWAQGSALRGEVQTTLKRWLAPPSRRVRWQKMLNASWKDSHIEPAAFIKLHSSPMSWNVGPLIASLPELLRAYNIDPQPVIEALRAEDDDGLSLFIAQLDEP